MTSEQSRIPRVHILHDNPDWLPPFAAALDRKGVPWTPWPLDGTGAAGSVDLDADPPAGIFWSRLSASAHTRGRAVAKEVARGLARWLEAHGRRVVGGSRVIELEVSKIAQHLALRSAGFHTPRTIAVFGPEELARRARELPAPFIVKHNQGGKGLGVRRFDSHEEFEARIAEGDLEEPVDGVTLLQEHVPAAQPFITRAEFVGGRFVYAVRVDTSAGSYELCPADACELPAPSSPGPAGPAVPEAGTQFRRREEVTAQDPFIARLGAFLRDRGVEIAGVEFIETADGRRVPYDVNTNTNYNPAVESDGGPSAADAVADFLAAELRAARADG